MNVTHTPVDGREARVLHHEADPQIPLVEVETDDLLQLLSRKADAKWEVDGSITRLKNQAKIIDGDIEDIVKELAKRGARNQQVGFDFNTRHQAPPASSREAEPKVVEPVNSAPIAQPGSARPALTGVFRQGDKVIDGTTGEYLGAYERIPQEAEPTFCVCGSTMNSPAKEHDVEHAAYVKEHVGELAPHAAAMPKLEASATSRHLDGVARLKCTSTKCDGEIILVESEKGKNLVIDAQPIDDGGYAIVGLTEEGVPIIRKATEADVARYQPHARVCAAISGARNGVAK